MSWWQLIPALACTATLLFLPGYLVVRPWGMRGLIAAGSAVPVSLTIVGLAAMVGPALGIRWNVWLVLVPTLIIAALGLALRLAVPALRRRPDEPVPRWRWPVVLLGVLIAATLLSRGLIEMIGKPEHISQTYDGIFHLNAVRYVLDTGSGSSLTIGGMATNGLHPTFYPAAWHDVISLVVQLTGVPISAATNALTLVAGALAWPVACIFLVTRVTGTKPVPILLTGALSAAFGAYPYLPTDFGVLYPTMLSIALLPSTLALAALAFGVGAERGPSRWLTGVVLLAALPGLALAHPSTFLGLFVLALPIAVVAEVRLHRRLAGRRANPLLHLPAPLALVACLALGVLVWTSFRPSAGASAWKPFESTAQAVGETLAAGPIGESATWIILVFTVMGLGLTVLHRVSWWSLGLYVLSGALFVVVASVPRGEFRTFVTGVWYNDSNRLAAQLPVAIVVIGTLGATWFTNRLLDRAARLHPKLAGLAGYEAPAPRVLVVAPAFLLAVAFGILAQFGSVNYAITAGRPSFEFQPDAPVLTHDEYTLLSRLGSEVPEHDVVLGNPWTGASLSYALGNRHSLTPDTGADIPPRVRYVLDHLGDIPRDQRVCADIQTLRSYYVLDFPGRQVHDRDLHFPGIETINRNPALTRIDSEGVASLYKITGCGDTPR